MQLIKEFASKLNSRKSVFIHVFGDSMIDENYKVKVSRISPECPNVNIIQSEDDVPSSSFPGGAANIAYQLSHFDLTARLFTFIDSYAYHIIRGHGVKHWAYVSLPEGHFVPIKKRYFEKGQQVVCRRDIEKSNYGLNSVSELHKQLKQKWGAFQAEPDVLIFSDYNKGFFSGDFNINWFESNAIKIVDPKQAPLEKWVGCTIFKPNKFEAEKLSRESDWKRQCDFFKSELRCKAVVITQEDEGVVGKVDDYFEYRPNIKTKPLDIVGAGDCFIGILSLAMVYGFSIEEAAKIAFHGGFMYVQQQQRGLFGPWSFHSIGKILKSYAFLKERNYKLVFANGCFDLIHSGHLQTLEIARSKGDKLVVAVNSDDSVRRLKGDSRPVLTLNDRMKLLAALDCVDFVISFDDDTPESLIQEIRPNILVKGSDWIGKEVAGANYVDEIFYVPLIEGNSTTSIIDKIRGNK